jgi:hypothetical protein
VSKKLVWWIVGIVAVLLLGAALWGPIVSNVEHPKYKVAERSGNIEIRDYDAALPSSQRSACRNSRVIALNRIVQASDPLCLAIVDGLDLPDGSKKPPSY